MSKSYSLKFKATLRKGNVANVIERKCGRTNRTRRVTGEKQAACDRKMSMSRWKSTYGMSQKQFQGESLYQGELEIKANDANQEPRETRAKSEQKSAMWKIKETESVT